MQQINYDISLQGFGPLAGPRSYSHYMLYLCKALALGWSMSILTPYKISCSTSLHWSISSLQSCSPSVGIYMVCSICCIVIISLQSFGPLAGPRACTHYIRPHRYIPTLTCFTFAKIQPTWLLCRHTYSMQHMQHINHIFEKLWAFGWPESILTLFKSS